MGLSQPIERPRMNSMDDHRMNEEWLPVDFKHHAAFRLEASVSIADFLRPSYDGRISRVQNV